jgi:nucleoid DNA-binding protein
LHALFFCFKNRVSKQDVERHPHLFFKIAYLNLFTMKGNTMAAKKKPAAKKAPAKKAPAKKVAAAAPVKKLTAVKEKFTKTQLVNELVDKTELSKKEVASVLDELGDIIERHVKKRAVGEFTLPGLLKIKTVKKPAQKARKNVPNPFKPGELMDVAAKPASTKVKVLPLKKLKDMVL